MAVGDATSKIEEAIRLGSFEPRSVSVAHRGDGQSGGKDMPSASGRGGHRGKYTRDWASGTLRPRASALRLAAAPAFCTESD